MRLRPLGAAVALVLVGALAACGGSTDEGAAASPTMSLPSEAMASSAAVASEDLVGGDPGTWAPILIRKKNKSVDLVPGQVAIFPAYEYAKNPNFVAVSSDPAVVEVLEAEPRSVVGLRAVGIGTATVKVYRGTDTGGQGKYLRKVKVTVAEQ